MVNKGVPTETDFPYQITNTTPCKKVKKRYFGEPKTFVWIGGGNLDTKTQQDYARTREEMKMEIFLNGPIAGSIAVFDDFYRYDGNSIYKPGKNAKRTSSHAIEIVGWYDEGVGTRIKGFEKDGY